MSPNGPSSTGEESGARRGGAARAPISFATAEAEREREPVVRSSAGSGKARPIEAGAGLRVRRLRDKLAGGAAMPEPPSIDSFVEAGLARWPSLRIDREALARHIAACPSPSLEHAGDLALTYACATRDDRAVRLLDPIVRSAAASAAAKLNPSPAFADEVAQKLLEGLVLSVPPKIASYGGRAPLRVWLRMASLRTALNLRRGQDDDVRARAPLTTSCDVVAPEADAGYLRARYKGDFIATLKRVLASLDPADRRLLRSYTLERATLEQLAASHGVGVATIWRRLKAIRARISNDTKASLRDKLRFTSSEYEGIAELVRSDIDVSVATLMRSSIDVE
jgi:RNA polymerase sigma-70 factor (ECF subfamily)